MEACSARNPRVSSQRGCHSARFQLPFPACILQTLRQAKHSDAGCRIRAPHTAWLWPRIEVAKTPAPLYIAAKPKKGTLEACAVSDQQHFKQAGWLASSESSLCGKSNVNDIFVESNPTSSIFSTTSVRETMRSFARELLCLALVLCFFANHSRTTAGYISLDSADSGPSINPQLYWAMPQDYIPRNSTEPILVPLCNTSLPCDLDGIRQEGMGQSNQSSKRKRALFPGQGKKMLDLDKDFFLAVDKLTDPGKWSERGASSDASRPRPSS